MKTHEIVILAVVLALFLAPCKALFAQKSNCGEIDAMARMARAISSGELAANRSKAAESYRARVVFAEMQFEFYPQKHDVALLLLNLIPKDDDERHVVMTLGDHLCDFETPHEMKLLNQIGNHFPRDLAKAALIAPLLLRTRTATMRFKCRKSAGPGILNLSKRSQRCPRRRWKSF